MGALRVPRARSPLSLDWERNTFALCGIMSRESHNAVCFASPEDFPHWKKVPFVLSRRGVLVALIGTCGVLALLGLVLSGGRAATERFPDVPLNYPYAAAIVDLSDRAIVNGYADGTFRPEAPVLRQQFAKTVTVTLGFAVSEADRCPFTDVSIGGPNTLYPDNYIAVGAARGIIRGTTSHVVLALRQRHPRTDDLAGRARHRLPVRRTPASTQGPEHEHLGRVRSRTRR